MAPEAGGEQAREVSDSKKSKEIAENPGLQGFATRHAYGRLRQQIIEDEFDHSSQKNETESGYQKRCTARKENAGDNNEQQIQRYEIAFMPSGDINQAGDQQRIADNLKGSVPARDGHPMQKDHVKQGKGVPENYQRNKITKGYDDLSILL